MEYHKVISELRTNKNIKVSDLIGDNMSRSSYNRFISGKTDIYSQHLLALLDQLHVSFSELEYIASGYNTSKEDTFFLKVVLAAQARIMRGWSFVIAKHNHLPSQSTMIFTPIF